MLPNPSDPRWGTFLTRLEDPPVKGFATKMLLMRLKMMVIQDRRPQVIEAAAKEACDFFEKNSAASQDDLRVILESLRDSQ